MMRIANLQDQASSLRRSRWSLRTWMRVMMVPMTTPKGIEAKDIFPEIRHSGATLRCERLQWQALRGAYGYGDLRISRRSGYPLRRSYRSRNVRRLSALGAGCPGLSRSAVPGSYGIVGGSGGDILVRIGKDVANRIRLTPVNGIRQSSQSRISRSRIDVITPDHRGSRPIGVRSRSRPSKSYISCVGDLRKEKDQDSKKTQSKVLHFETSRGCLGVLPPLRPHSAANSLFW